jgi:hypothetical protein
MKSSRTIAVGITSICMAALSACATAPSAETPAPGCADEEITAEQLVGTWRVALAGQAMPWTLLLRPHPEHEGSLRGTLMQSPQHFAVVADMEDGEFTMEESHDGQRIAATWLGQLQAGSCGRIIAGERQDGTTGQAPQRFQMWSDRSR